MKKTIGIMLTVLLFLNGLTVSVTAGGTDGLTEKQRILIDILGIYNEEKNFDETLTRAEFAEMLAHAALPGDVDFSAYENKNEIRDVDEFHEYYEPIKALCSFGYIKTDNFGRFLPDEKITMQDAYSMVLLALGYNRVSEINYGSEIEAVSRLMLNKNVKASDGNELSVYSAYIMLYNMLYCNVSQLYKNRNNKLLYMTQQHRLYEISGIVTDDGIVSYSGNSEVGIDYIAIDGEKYVNDSGRYDLFALNAFGYYTDKYDEPTILGICENTGKNEVTVITSNRITNYAKRTYQYYEDDTYTKEKKISIPDDVIIMYNEKMIGLDDKFTKDMFNPKSGRIRIYDNNADGTADILRIEDYKSALVGTVDTEELKIYTSGKNLKIIDLDDKDYRIEDKDGNEVNLEDIAKNNVISYLESPDGSFVKILVSTQKNSAEISGYGSDNNGVAFTKAGGKYELNDGVYAEYGAFEYGEKYIFYFDVFNMVTAYEKDTKSDTLMYGVLTKIGIYENRPEDNTFKIYTTDGEPAYYRVNKKIKVINSDSEAKNLKDKDVDEITYRGVVRYKVDIDNNITYLEIPYTNGEKPDETGRLFYLVDSVTDSDGGSYYPRVQNGICNYGGSAIIDSNTKVFFVTDDLADTDDFSVGSPSSIAQGGEYNLYAFGTDYKSKTAECVAIVTEGSTDETSPITNEWAATVVSVKNVYDTKESAEVKEITLMDMVGNTVSYYMKNDVYNNKVLPWASGSTTPVQLKAGDIIFYRVSNRYIVKATAVYDTDYVVKDEKGNDLTGAIAGTQISYYGGEKNALCNPFGAGKYESGMGGSYQSWTFANCTARVFSGWVYSYENGYLQVTNQNPAYGYDLKATKNKGFITNVYTIQTGRGVLTTGDKHCSVRTFTDSDIKPYTEYGADCTRVVITQRLYDLRSVNFYN